MTSSLLPDDWRQKRQDTPMSRGRVAARPGSTSRSSRGVSGRFAREALSQETFGGQRRFCPVPAVPPRLTVLVTVWLGWNTPGAPRLQFDPRSLNYTLLTLLLSLGPPRRAPWSCSRRTARPTGTGSPSNRDRAATRNLADTEFLTGRSLRCGRLWETATRDFVRSELRGLLAELDARDSRPRKHKNGGPWPASLRS